MTALWRERFAAEREIVNVGPGNVPDRLPQHGFIQVQFSEELAPHEHEQLAGLLADHPHAYLRAFCFFGQSEIRSLDFLEHYRALTGFHADLYDLKDFGGLRHLPRNVRYVGLGKSKYNVVDLRVLAKLDGLEDLDLEGQTNGLGDVLASGRSLRRLALRSVTLPDLDPLRPLKALECFELRLGGTRDLALLPQIGRLQYLEIWMVSGLADLSSLAALTSLEELFLQSLARVKSLPDLSGLERLKRVHLESMKGLADLGPIAKAPALEVLQLIAMNHLKPEALRPFVGHPALRQCRIGLGSLRRNAAAYELLGFPVPMPASSRT
jgi:hypothetical protein